MYTENKIDEFETALKIDFWEQKQPQKSEIEQHDIFH
jgi:hypothetical protein